MACSSFGLLLGLQIVACDVGENKLGEESQSGGEEGGGSEGGSETEGVSETDGGSGSTTDPGGGCEPGDIQPAGDGCNTCSCSEDGMSWACTEIGCPACEDGDVTQNPDGCLCDCIEGAFVCPDSCESCEPGETMPAGDGCNTCTCEDDGVSWACTAIGCPQNGNPFEGPEVVVCEDGVPMDPVNINDVTIDGDTLTVDVAYGGGCEMHLLGGCWDELWAESSPVQTGLAIAHDGMDDPCDAFPSDQVVLDLSPISAAYMAAYGAGPATVHINLDGWPETIVYSF